MTKIYKTWIERLESGVITYGQMLSFVANVGGWVFDDKPRGRRTSLDYAEADNLLSILRAKRDGLALADGPGKWYDTDQRRYLTWSEYGRQWVARNGRRAGLPAEMVEAAERLTFTFVDVATAERGPGFAPVYRAHDPSTGRSWNYSSTPWQARL